MTLTNISNEERFFQNFLLFQADASKLLKNLEEMFPLYYMHSDMFRLFFQPHNSVGPGATTLSFGMIHHCSFAYIAKKIYFSNSEANTFYEIMEKCFVYTVISQWVMDK